jgi:hypothetical protein
MVVRKGVNFVQFFLEGESQFQDLYSDGECSLQRMDQYKNIESFNHIGSKYKNAAFFLSRPLKRNLTFINPSSNPSHTKISPSRNL